MNQDIVSLYLAVLTSPIDLVIYSIKLVFNFSGADFPMSKSSHFHDNQPIFGPAFEYLGTVGNLLLQHCLC